MLDILVEVPLVAFPVFSNDRLSLGVGEVLDTLVALQVELDPVSFVASVDETEGVTSESMHVAVGIGNTTVAHDDRNLVQGLRQRRPKIPVVLRTPHVRPWIPLDGVVQVGEFEGIPEKEDGSVVPDQVPVPFFRVELDRKTLISRSASAAPRSPATVEKRMKRSVVLPTSENMFAFVY
jgi:hypothetical protein